MVKRKVIWSNKAKARLYEIYEYYNSRNKSTSYSRQLNQKIHQHITLIHNHPEIGIATDLENVRGLIMNDYVLFYEVLAQFILIHSILDTRQSPLEWKK